MIRIRLSDYICLALLLSAAIAAFSPLINVHQSAAFGEATAFYGTPLQVAKEIITKYGQLPLWDPWTGAGDAMLANPLATQFYPLSFIAYLSTNPALDGVRWLAAFHLAAATLAFYWLARISGAQPWAAILAPVLFVMNAHTEWRIANGIIGQMMALPWTALAWMLALVAARRLSIQLMAGIGLTLGMMILAGTVYDIYFAGLGVAVLLLTFGLHQIYLSPSRLRPKRVIRLSLMIGVGLLSTVAVSAVKLLPVIRFQQFSTRVGFSLEEAEVGLSSIPTVAALARDAFTPIEPQWGWPINICIVIAVAKLFLKPSREAVAFGFIALIGFWASLGMRMPVDLYGFFHWALPGFAFNNTTIRFMNMFYPAYAILAAIGISSIAESTRFRIAIPQTIRTVALLIENLASKLLLLRRYMATSIGIRPSQSTASTVTSMFRISPSSKLSPLVILVMGISLLALTASSSHVRSSSISAVANDSYSLRPVNGSSPFIFSQSYTQYGGHSHRIFSTYIFSKDQNRINATTAALYGLDITNPINAHMVPSYQLMVNYKPSPLATKRQYRLLNILNTRYFIYEDLYKIAPPDKTLKELEIEGGLIFETSEMRGRSQLITNPILLVGKDIDSDFNAFEARLVVFHNDFDPAQTTILHGGSPYLDDYDLEFLRHFDVIVLTDWLARSSPAANALLEQFQDHGGTVINMTYIDNPEKNPFIRAGTFLTGENPPKELTQESIRQLALNLGDPTYKPGISIQPILTSFSPSDITLEVGAISETAALTLSQTYFPGWRATVDNNETPVFMADSLVTGIIVPAGGPYTIRFYFDPPGINIVALISIASILITSIFIIQALRKPPPTHAHHLD